MRLSLVKTSPLLSARTYHAIARGHASAEPALTPKGFSDNLRNPFALHFMSSPRATHHTLGLTNDDFDAYLPERATSNAFTPPRLDLKQRMVGWAKGVVARLTELGVSVDVASSDDHPSLRNGRRVDYQRVLFWRNAEARAQIESLIDKKRSLSASLGDPAPYQKHAFLALRVDSRQLEVGVEIHPEAWVDVRNLRARLTDPARTLELTSALEALPEQFSIGLAEGTSGSAARATGKSDGDQEEKLEAQKATSQTIRSLLDRAEREGRSLWVGWTVPRDVAVTHSAVLDDQLEDAALALGPIYKLIAWAVDNDHVVLGQQVDAVAAERARVHEEAERERTRSNDYESRRARERESKRRATPPPIELSEPESTTGRVAASAGEDAADAPATAGHGPLANRGKRAAIVKSPNRAVTRRVASVIEVDPSIPIEKGTRVQVLAGPFMGKVGVVQELDGKGAARVMLGLLATRLEVENLIASAEGKDRPALASSHRKPLPARS